MKLSEVMWVQAGFGNSRKVMPFVVNKNIICNLSDDRLFQLEERKSMFNNLYEICQNEYGFSTVIMGSGKTDEIPKLDTSKGLPTIMSFRLPAIFTAAHKKEYVETRDMTVKPSEVKALSKYFTKQLERQIQNAGREREC